MLLNSISHIVCKFQKDWMKNKKKIKTKFGDGPLNAVVCFTVRRLVRSTRITVDMFLFPLSPL